MENRNLGVIPKKVDPGFIFLKKELEIFTLYGTQIGRQLIPMDKEIVLNRRCFKIDKTNAKAMIAGFIKNSRLIHQAIYCDVVKKPLQEESLIKGVNCSTQDRATSGSSTSTRINA